MSEVALAPLSTLWSARTLRVVPPVHDLEAIAETARALGHAAGRAEAEAELATLCEALGRAVEVLNAARTIDPAELQPLFVELVTRIAAEVVGGELRQSADAVERLVAAALAAVEVDAKTIVFLSPDDATSLACHPCLRGDDGEEREDSETVYRVVPDPTLAPGCIRIETAAHVISASLTTRLAAIVAGL